MFLSLFLYQFVILLPVQCEVYLMLGGSGCPYRDVNEVGFKFNKQTHLAPVLASVIKVSSSHNDICQ